MLLYSSDIETFLDRIVCELSGSLFVLFRFVPFKQTRNVKVQIITLHKIISLLAVKNYAQHNITCKVQMFRQDVKRNTHTENIIELRNYVLLLTFTSWESPSLEPTKTTPLSK